MSEEKIKQQHHRKEDAGGPGVPSPDEQVKKEEPQKTETAKGKELPVDTVNDLKRRLDEQSDRYLRLMAEFDNFKKRVSRDYERLVETANEKLMTELIEVRENMERAVKAGEQCEQPDALREGMKLIASKFNEILFKNGLEAFGSAGEPFDPQLHDALMKIPHAKVHEDHVIEVFEKGYTLKKRVIRHAKVVVSSGQATENNDTVPEEEKNTEK